MIFQSQNVAVMEAVKFICHLTDEVKTKFAHHHTKLKRQDNILNLISGCEFFLFIINSEIMPILTEQNKI